MEPEPRLSRHAHPALRSLLAGMVLLFLALLATACRKPVQPGPKEIRLYDLNGGNRLVCTLAASSRGPAQGAIRSKSPGGETFLGEWIQVATEQTADQAATSKYPSSLPVLPGEQGSMLLNWGWAADLGIDFKNFPDHYFSFMLYGDAGTLISGFFVDHATSNNWVQNLFQSTTSSGKGPQFNGLLGAAKDNRGHRYKLMG
jgi:hypothetical protein